MFWGLIMEPKRRYTQVVKKPFHISMASLDISSANNEPTQVLLTYDGRNYLLCTLQKTKDVQVPLDLNFEEGNEVSFATNGSSHVHLTGYLLNELDESEEEEEETSKNDNEVKIKKERKRKGAGDNNSVVVPKKSKTAELLDAVANEDSDSDDMNFSDILREEGDEISDEDDDDLEEESEDDDDGEEEEDHEDEDAEEGENEEDEDESSLSDEEVVNKSGKINGITPTKKKEKNKTKEQKQQQKTPKQLKKEGGKTNKDGVKTPKEVGKTQKDGNKTPKEAKTPQKENGKAKTPGKDQKTPQEKKKVLEGGVQIQDIVVGHGQVAKPGKFVQVYYEGRLKSNNKVFDSTKQGNGFKFRLGSQEVIKGWDVGVQGMKVGGKRRIVCPPNMAYGQKGSPPVIPANSTLIFEVELKNVH